MANRTVLTAGEDFESSWIEEVTFEPIGSGAVGIGSVLMNGKRYGYCIKTDQFQKFQTAVAATLDPANEDASTGSAYNDYIKLASINNAVGLGQVAAELPSLPDADAEELEARADELSEDLPLA